MNEKKKTILFLINGLGVGTKDSFDLKINEIMPNLSIHMSNYMYSNLENISYNYKNAYRNFSLGNDLLPTYHKLEEDNNLVNNKTINMIANDAISNGTKIHLFCFLDNNQVVSQVIKLINVLRPKGSFKICIHPILRQKEILEYDEILKLLKSIEDKITLYKNVDIGVVAGERVISKDSYYQIFEKGLGERWPDYSRKINYSKTSQITPRDLNPFYLNSGFKLAPNDISLFLNYEDIDCDDFISKLRYVKLYTLFPMKSFSYAINIYDEIEPLDFFTKKLDEYDINCSIYTDPNRIKTINYMLNGLKEINNNHVTYYDINDKNYNIENALNKDDDLVIFDYNIDQFNELSKLREYLMYLDEILDNIYNICIKNEYNMFITSLYGIYKDDYVIGVDRNVKLDYSSEVPVIMINQNYSAAKFALKYGKTYDLSNTIIFSIINNQSIPNLIRKRGIISFFKD